MQQRGRTAADLSAQLTLRTFLDQPLVAISSGRPLTGQVFRHDELAQDGARVPYAGIEVVLDRARRTRTDAQGRYVFESPGVGAHTIEAVLPALDSAYFTTPSMVSRQAGESADFGVALSGVRVTGHVRTDAGLPLAGVSVRVEGSSTSNAVTDSGGMWRTTVAPGELRISVVPETLPAAYDLRELQQRILTLAPREPATVQFTVRALRSVEGVVAGLRGQPVSVIVVETGRAVKTDAEGRFVVRQLPAGQVTLQVEQAGVKGAPVVVNLPQDPGGLKGVRLQAP
jgi:hypothetical protein